VTWVLGGHIEVDTHGNLFSWESQYHPKEHVLQMTADDLLALPVALRSFNGIYTVRGQFVMMNSIRVLIIAALLLLAILGAPVALAVRLIRRRRRARRLGLRITTIARRMKHLANPI
jgi:hydroxyacylglutathione hydrolase